ncbi:MAG: tetratricopeptide repeat protein [Desulfomonile tiedjei]|nr:tetratricopeptide repeat protein [Desulfomonile tiedjei]
MEFEKAAAFRIEGKNQRAVEAFDRVLSVYPDHVAALVQKGAALEDQGKWKEAAKTYRQALEFDPENLAANRNLQQLLSSKMMDTPLGGATPAKEDLINSGLEALEARDFHRALEIFGLSSGLFPEDPRTLFYQAYTFEKQGKLQEALEIYAKTAETFPDHAAARIHRVICLLALGDRKLAQKEAQRARELLKDSLEVRALGRVTNGPWPSGSDAQTLKQWDKGQ